ncbi:MAG: carboxymuconolactone decarboxylase family protein [Desulfurococcaceae archaeon]
MSSRERLEEIRRELGELVAKADELKSFLEYVERAESGRALDTKTKELMSLAIAVAIRCEPCIMWHANAALRAGATLDEVLDAIKVAVCMGGGPALMYGLKAYQVAKEFAGSR